MTGLSYNALLLDQFTWHWDNQLRPRLAGLTDEEYFWEPVPGCWSLRARGTSAAPLQGGSGDLVIEFALPQPDPAPVTTIAWRLAHVIAGVLAMRNASHFGAAPADYLTFDYPQDAGQALARLDAEVARWLNGVRALVENGLARPCGPAEGPYAADPMARLVLHINRELIHHLSEVSLLRDLYARAHPAT